MPCPDIISAQLTLQGKRQPVARFELRAALEVYFRRSPHSSVTGSVYVYAVTGSMRVLVTQKNIGDGYGIDVTATGAKIISLRNVMADAIEIETDASAYLSDEGGSVPFEAIGYFSVIAWGDQPSGSGATDISNAADSISGLASPLIVDAGRLRVIEQRGYLGTPDAFAGVEFPPAAAQAQLSTANLTWAATGVARNGEASLKQLLVTSKSASNAWLLLYDAAAVPADGGALPTLLLAIPVGPTSLVALELTRFGLHFATGITFVMSSSPNVQTTLVAADFKTLWQYALP